MDNQSNTIIFNHVARRISRNKNALILCASKGDTGSGKSYGVLRFAEKFSKNFDVRKHCQLRIIPLLKLFNQDNPKGTSIIADEVGLSMGARSWNSVFNKIMSFFLQAFRFKNYVVFFTVPDLSFVDVHLRKMFHYYMCPISINYKTQVAKFKFYRVVINQETGKPMFKPIIYEQDGERKAVITMFLKIPSKLTVLLYEHKRKTEVETSFDGLIDELEVLEGKKKAKKEKIQKEKEKTPEFIEKFVAKTLVEDGKI